MVVKNVKKYRPEMVLILQICGIAKTMTAQKIIVRSVMKDIHRFRVRAN